jgi:hypothetical protein
VREKKDPAMPAAGQARAQTRLGSQSGSQQQITLQYQTGYRALSIPVEAELKMLLNPDCKKPKFSLRMLMKYSTSSSYPIDTQVSSKWDEDFLCTARLRQQSRYLERNHQIMDRSFWARADHFRLAV